MLVDEKREVKPTHSLILENRKSLAISGVSDVDSFDDQTIVTYTEIGELTIKGSNLHINKLNLEVGELVVSGEISSLFYTDNVSSNGSFISKLFR